MRDCLYAIRTALLRSALFKTGCVAIATTLLLAPAPAYALLDRIKDLTLQTEDNVEEEECLQAWPVDCSQGGGGGTGCGGWNMLKNLAEPENLHPDDGYASCSTGVRIGMGRQETQGQAVGAMFDGLVIFSQAGRSRDGRDYGGVVVIKLNLQDGSPQCFARYMFLDRRDLVRTGTEVKAGQRIGSVASDDMSPTKQWWRENWGNNMPPQVKIDIGCDEALANLPHFMPKEPHNGNSEEDPHNCPLTKLRFPAPPLTYLVNTEHGGNTACHVGVRKDAREGIRAAPEQDESERNMQVTGEYVETVKPRGVIKRKETPVFSLFKNEESRNNYFGANRQRTNGSLLFRNHINYRAATALGCSNMEELFNGKRGESLDPKDVRELLTHCTNQYILGRASFSKVFEQNEASATGMLNPLPERMLRFMDPEAREEYESRRAADHTGLEIFRALERDIIGVYWRDLCQPLHMEEVHFEDYKPRELLTKSWRDLLIEWPQEREYTPINRRPIPRMKMNDYTEYPYERINDPSHPFSPRHIFAETERERYSNYRVQCATTPVDIILGRYDRGNLGVEESLETYGIRDTEFHQCIRCRIELNETKEACFPDPYSFSNPGGCQGGFGAGNTAGSGELCDNLDDQMMAWIDELEQRYGLVPKLLHGVATQESGCSAERGVISSAGAQGMFQFMPGTAAQYGIDPWDPIQAAEGAARYYASSAQQFNCDLPLMLAAYNCGPGCAADYRAGRRSRLPEETVNYIANISHMIGDPPSGCAAGGPYPQGNGPYNGQGAGVGSGSGSGSGSGGGLGDTGNVFGHEGGNTSGGGAAIGRFDPSGCPAGYTGNQYSFTATATSSEEGGSAGGSFTCAPYSYPTPDLPGPGTFGCHGRTFYPPGCDSACQDRFNSRCNPIRAYYNAGGASRSSVCSNSSCPPRIHEGMDIAFEYGAPVYASAAGVVTNINEDGTFLTVDHSGKCIDPDCNRRFPSGTMTKYFHMGSNRIMVESGQEVERCQQIGTVGDARSEGVPHLHWEAWEAGSKMGQNITSHWGLAQDENFHAHIDDKSCTGGIWDPDGTMGGRGICQYALPLDTRNKEDLEPPSYFEEYEFPEVTMPDPPSPDRGDEFDLETPGMVYNGAWTECRNVPSGLRALCEELNETEGSETDSSGGRPISGGLTSMINPVPCHPLTSPFGYRVHPILGTRKLHTGIDIGAPGGIPIFAAADGVIEISGASGGWGNFVVVRHADGSKSEYAHQSQICPQSTVGSTVVQGQVLGYVGTTGMSTGNHLHFNVRDTRGEYMDPYNAVPAQTPGAPQCPQINAMRCGQTIDGQPVGSGVAGATGKILCVDKPCTLRYDEADTVSQCAYPTEDGGCGTLGHFSQRDEEDNGDCCYKITAPVTPLNILKIRPGYDGEVLRPGSDDIDDFLDGAWEGERVNDGVPNSMYFGEGGSVQVTEQNPGAPEGYTFHEHFRNHRPYMRWWDTGAESGHILKETTAADSAAGSLDALVGVGIEKNNCGIGGWGRPQDLDGNTSWLELKLYQARSQHMNGLRCIARYEKVFKRGASEDYAHRLAGGNFDTSVTGTASSGSVSLNFPLGWRGYASENDTRYRFPYMLSYPQYDLSAHDAVTLGLDGALPGDIIVYDKDVTDDKRLQHVAYVLRADNAAMRSRTGSQGESPLTAKRFFPPPTRGEMIPSVTVLDYNHGRYPDACGNTNWWAVGPERKIYKGDIPENMKSMARRQGVTDVTCGNPDLTACAEPLWGSIKVYRPRAHVRN